MEAVRQNLDTCRKDVRAARDRITALKSGKTPITTSILLDLHHTLWDAVATASDFASLNNDYNRRSALGGELMRVSTAARKALVQFYGLFSRLLMAQEQEIFEFQAAARPTQESGAQQKRKGWGYGSPEELAGIDEIFVTKKLDTETYELVVNKLGGALPQLRILPDIARAKVLFGIMPRADGNFQCYVLKFDDTVPKGARILMESRQPLPCNACIDRFISAYKAANKLP
ncbi:MAG TPA: hypothetical protein VGK99_11385 [Acidobacteriota bacterium]